MRRLSIIVVLILLAPPLAAQYSQQTSAQTSTMARALPSASVNISPNPGKTNQAMTVTGTLSNPPLYYGTQPPAPQYTFVIRKPDNTELWRRDFATSSTASWTPTATGSYYVIGGLKTFKQDGTQDKVYDMPRRDFTVVAPGLGWTTPITAETLGSTPASHLLNKTISEIVNSSKLGRTDGQYCRDCHYKTSTSKMYRPDNSVPITPSTTINRGDGYNSTYRWNMAGASGIVERFCNTPSPNDKPTDLCAVFRRWAAGNYLP